MGHIKNTSQEDHSRGLVEAEKLCIENGVRLTVKRKQILSILLEVNKAVSAYDIIDQYKETYGEALPAMSVYRILEFLENEQLVHKLRLANKFVACSHIQCDNAHKVSLFFICTQCDQVKEATIKPSTFDELKDSGLEAGFVLDTPQLEISCICSTCR